MEPMVRPLTGSEQTQIEWQRLFDREREPMLRMAVLMVGSPAVAEEIVQDAFLAVGTRWESIERHGGYLRTTVVRGCAQHLRRRGLEQRANSLEPSPPAVEIPSRLVELRDALTCLPDRQRLVVVLRYFVDLPDDEIAATIGARPATVRSLAHRAMATLRKELS